MKAFIELTYQLDKEPEEFKEIPLKKRKIYLSKNKRYSLEEDRPLVIHSLLSEMIEEPDEGFMEIWYNETNTLTNTIDDMWETEFKSINREAFNIEWHPGPNTLILSWDQSINSLKQSKLLTAIVNELNRLNLNTPKFPNFIT